LMIAEVGVLILKTCAFGGVEGNGELNRR